MSDEATESVDKRFAGRSLSDRVMAGLPDETFRLLFGLIRFGALTFDEALTLEWSDCKFDDCQLAVRRRRGLRLCPMTSEMEELLRDARDARRPRADRVLAFELPTLSVRLILKQHIQRALGKPEPQAIQMLRAAGEAELAGRRD
jgi:hypothetical protein